MAVTGGCRCGAVRYVAQGEPAHHALCHCTQCRRSAGAFVIGWAMFAQTAVAIEGEPVTYESSPGTFRRFCGTCGTGLFYVDESVFPGMIDVQSGTLDEPDAMPAQLQIQVADAPRWMAGYSELAAFERFPEP